MAIDETTANTISDVHVKSLFYGHHYSALYLLFIGSRMLLSAFSPSDSVAYAQIKNENGANLTASSTFADARPGLDSIIGKQFAMHNPSEDTTATGKSKKFDDTEKTKEDTCNCTPKYEELNFLRKGEKPTFSAKEMWTLDRGKGTDIFMLQCDSTIENILELIDFKDRSLKEKILLQNYEEITDHAGRKHIKANTPRGTRYFTIQSRDEENAEIVGIDGRIDYSRLKDHGNRMLRLYIMVGKELAIDKKSGLSIIKPLDSGEILIPYCDCIPTPELPKMPITIRDTVYVPEVDTSKYAPEDMHTKTEQLLASNKLLTNILGNVYGRSRQWHTFDCGPLKISSKPGMWQMMAYARTLDNLHINSELEGTHANLDFLDSARNNVGVYGITTLDFVFDARYNLLHLTGPNWNAPIGIGPGAIFEYNAATYRGDVNENPLDGSNSRYSGLAGVVFFLNSRNLSANNASLAFYAGRSSELGSLLNTTVRINALQIGDIADIDMSFFAELYNGEAGSGNRTGLFVLAAGPQIMGMLSPAIGFQAEKTLYPYDGGNLTSGTRSSILVGLKADLGRYIGATR